MRIGPRKIIAIHAFFVGIVLAGGALAYSTARERTISGLRADATSLAVALARPVDGDPLLESAIARDRTAGFPAFGGGGERPVGNGQVKHVFALTPVGTPVGAATRGEPNRVAGLPANAPFVPPDSLLRPGAAEMDRLAGGRAVSREVLHLPGDIRVVTAFAPMIAPGGELAGIVGVVIDAGSLEALSRRLPLTLGRLVLVALVAATLTSLLLASPLADRDASTRRSPAVDDR